MSGTLPAGLAESRPPGAPPAPVGGAGPPATPQAALGGAGARAQLLELLRRDGILHRSPDQPVLSGDGRSARWMLDTLSVTLAHPGAELTARCLVDLLQQFESRQIATYGLTGVPLLQGCILHGGGRYRGALVRKERKPYGAMKLIEGRLDPAEPVVIVDDSISSGYSMTECARRLEAAGFEVEGGVCLVRFDFDRGPARMLEAGYRIAAVFDIWEDFIRNMEGEAPYPLNPTKDVDAPPLSRRRAAEHLHPAELARRVMVEHLATGQALRPPHELDRSYDVAGGCWVSLRRRTDVHDRLARSGHWHFPGEARGTAAADVVLASLKAAADLHRRSDDPSHDLDDCAIAVTFFSELEECTVGELDNDRYGIVVRSAVRAPRMGGALPRMPGIANEWQQLWHAARTNARLLPNEPYVIYRHDVEKVVEPGAAWQPTGVPAPQVEAAAPSAGAALAAHARRTVLEAVRAPQARAEVARVDVPAEVDAAFVTVYANGRVAGCIGGPCRPAGDWLHECAVAAAHDRRFVSPDPGDRIAVAVSLLSNRLEVGEASPEWVVGPLRFGDQVLEVHQGDQRALLLPLVCVTSDLTPLGYVEEVIDKAGIAGPPYRWTRYDCASWLADGTGVRPLVNGLPQGAPATDPAAQLERMRKLLVGFTSRHHSTTGPVLRRYDPFSNSLSQPLGSPRLAFGAWVKARAGLEREAGEDARRLEGAFDDGWIQEEGTESSISELAFLLLALSALGTSRPAQEALAARLWDQVDCHGRFVTHRTPESGDDVYQDYAPGQALLALAAGAAAGVTEVRADVLARALRHYRMRFRQNHSWGAVAWLMQAFCAWGRVLGDPSLTGFACEVADWALGFQSAKTGAFLNDHQSDTPGATTALYVEGLAVVAASASAAGGNGTSGPGDGSRAARYQRSCDRALAFLDQLVYQERDAPVLPDPERALGGVRRSVTSGAVFVDYVHHALNAVLTLQGARP